MRGKIIFFAILVFLLLPSCGSKAPTWQEEYDLGIRYLSEGNYEEAVIAFTAAIEIDPKQVPAYIGRGDAYVGLAELAEGHGSDAFASYQSAEQDYLYAIDLDETLAELYGKLADVYLALGDQDKAVAILERGVEATEDEELLALLEQLRIDRPEGASKIITAEGYIFYNPDMYRNTWHSYIDIYQNQEENIYCSIETYGIRFLQEIQVEVNSKKTHLREAHLSWASFTHAFDYSDEKILLHNYETDSPGTLLNRTIKMTGYFIESPRKEELTGPEFNDGNLFYSYHPNGDYEFCITAYEELF